MINVRKLSVYDDNCYIVVVGSGMEDGNMQEQVNRNLPMIKAACLHLNRRSVFLFCLLVDQEYMKNQNQRTKLKRNNTCTKGQRTKGNKKN
jgi:hypothetical protein